MASGRFLPCLINSLSLFQTRYKTNEPVWEETHTFLIHNPRTQELEVEVLRRSAHSKESCLPLFLKNLRQRFFYGFQVKDEKHDCSLGTLTLPLTRLLEAEDMTLNQRFPLKNSGPSCTLTMKIALRVGPTRIDMCSLSWRWGPQSGPLWHTSGDVVYLPLWKCCFLMVSSFCHSSLCIISGVVL